ncbi:MAG: antibiotic biosynthesis monooxygenase [Chloroflexota bacterium]
MFIALVQVHVKPDQVDAFKDLIRANHLGSVQEPGCLRFAVAQSVDDATRFALWEWYVDADAAKAHKGTPHYLAFKAGSADMMAEERVSTRYDGLFPETGVRSA